MKFTVGMLDASAVFLKDPASKTGTPNMVRDQAQQEESKLEQEVKYAPEPSGDHHMQEYHELYPNYMGANEISPNVSTSTENAYPYEVEYASNNMALAPDVRPQWSGFSDNVNFTTDDVQDWSLDQLYNFDNMPNIEDILGNRRIVEEYDESGNNFAGF